MKEEKQLNCPACGKHLSKLQAGQTIVDACDNGCGGVWFDNYELKKVDEKAEEAGEILLKIKKDPTVLVDYEKKRFCPVCPNQPMLRFFQSVKKNVCIDNCPTCNGTWLDTGELSSIRNEYDSDEERTLDARQEFTKVCERIDHARDVLYNAENINKLALTNEEQMKLLESTNLREDEKQMLVENDEEDAFNRIDKKVAAFKKAYPFLYFDFYNKKRKLKK